MSVPYGQLLIDLSTRRDDRTHYCSNSGPIPSIFLFERLKCIKSLDDEHTTFLYSPSVPIFFPQVQKLISAAMSKDIYSVSFQKQSKFASKRPKKHRTKASSRVSKKGSPFLKETTWKQKTNFLAFEEGLHLIIVNFPTVIDHCFDMDQLNLVLASVYNKGVST